MASAYDRVVRIINTTTGAALRPTDVTISDVRENDNADINRNTRCQLVARNEGRLQGAGPFFYNRLDLGKLFHGQRPIIALPLGTRVTTQSLAAMLASRYGVDLLPEDVEQSGEILLQSFPRDLELVAVEGCYCVTGKVTIRIVDYGKETSEALGITGLSGLNAPNGDLSKVQGVFYSWDWVAQTQLLDLIDAALKGDGYLTAEATPYIANLSGDAWVFDAAPAQYNLSGAKVVYKGNRDDHPVYSTGGRRDEIIVIRLSDLCTEVGGDLVIIL